MQAYGKGFAKVYNALWGDFARRISPLISEFYESTPLGRQNKTLLDLCCGTGQLSLFFLSKGYKVLGLDLSDEMLHYARENTLPFLPGGQARFIQGDAADFQLDEKFGLAVSSFDALNHLPDMESLKGCFRATFEAVEDGGYFIFDLNTRLGLTRWNGVFVHPGDDIFFVNRSIYDDLTVRAWTKITGFAQNEDGLYERFEETIYNSVFEMQDVLAELQQAGFQTAYFAKASDLAAPIEEPEAEPRVFFIARK